MQATCSSCANVVTVDENNPKLPAGAFSVKCPKCQTPVRFPARTPAKAAPSEPSRPAPAADTSRPAETRAAAPAAKPAAPIRPTALPGERALVALDDKRRATEVAKSLEVLGYEVDVMSDADGVRNLDQGVYVIVVMARTVAESDGALTCYQRLFLLNSDTRRSFFLILVGDEYTTSDGVQAFVVHGDLVVASQDTPSCEAIIRDRLVERTRLFRVFIDCKRKLEAAAAGG